MSETTEMMSALEVPPDTAATGLLEVRSAPRLHYIDGLRGLAMLMVLLYHCWIFGGMWSIGPTLGGHHFNVAPILGFGHIGVNLFLVLSGFCLYWPFVKGGTKREPTLWEFARKRCRRILPPYYVTLILFSAVPLVQALYSHDAAASHYTLNWLLLHALMLHNTRPEYVLSINGSLWSLALEFQLYILFPVLVEAYRRFNARGVLLTVLLVCTVYRSFLVWDHYTPDDGSGYVLAYSIFGRGFEFALGMFTALMIARWHKEQKSPLRWADALLPSVVIPLAVLDGRHGHFQALTDAMWGLLFAALLLAGSRTGTRLHHVLSHRLLVGLGLFSYSVYLIHLPLVIALGEFAMHHLSNTQNVLFQLFLVIPLMLGLGYLFHLLFERPFMSAPRDRDPSTRPSRFWFRRRSSGEDPTSPTPLVVSAVSNDAASPAGLVSEPIPPIM